MSGMNSWSFGRHIAVALGLKAIALTALWWFFVRDARVTIHEDAAAAHLLPPPAVQAVATPDQGAPR